MASSTYYDPTPWPEARGTPAPNMPPPPHALSSWDPRPGLMMQPGPGPMQQPSSSSAVAAQSGSDDPNAFGSQLEEVDRAMENMVKSGKFFPRSREYAGPSALPGMPPAMVMGPQGGPVLMDHTAPQPLVPRGYPVGAGPNGIPPPPPPPLSASSNTPVDDMSAGPRPSSGMSSVANGMPGFNSNYYAPPPPPPGGPMMGVPGRFQASPSGAPGIQNNAPPSSNQQQQSRNGDPDHVLQIRRRIAAARERDLRNYHQERQLGRTMSPDSSRFSNNNNNNNNNSILGDVPVFGAPSSQEDEQTRQRKAFYAPNSSSSPPTGMQPGTNSSNGSSLQSPMDRGASPRLAFDPFAPHAGRSQSSASLLSKPSMPAVSDLGEVISRTGSADGARSPSVRSNFSGLFESRSNVSQKQQLTGSTNRSNSPPELSPSLSKTTSWSQGVAPIGTRPSTVRPASSLSQLSQGTAVSDSRNPSISSERHGATTDGEFGRVGSSLEWSSRVWGENGKSNVGMTPSVWA